MTVASILPIPRTIFIDSNGVPLSGGFVYTYIPPNTSAPKTTWQDATGSVSNANPIVLDTEGSALIYGSGQYLIKVYDSLSNLIYTGLTQDNYSFVMTSNNTFTGTETFSGAVTFGSTVSLGSSATATTPAPGDNDTSVATTAFVTAAIAAATTIVPQKYIAGCLLSSLSGNHTTASITVGSGQAVDSTNVSAMTSAGYSWAAANGNAINGTDASSSTLANSTTYHMFLINGGSGTGTFASASLTPTFPTGYTTYSRRIGSFVTNSSGAPIPYTSIEVEGGAILNWLTTQLLDVTVTNLSSARVLYALTVPSGIKVQPIYRADNSGSTYLQVIIFTSGDETDIAPTGQFEDGYTTVPGYDIGTTPTFATQSGSAYITTNTSAQIGARGISASTHLYLVTRGWKDWRRS